MTFTFENTVISLINTSSIGLYTSKDNHPNYLAPWWKHICMQETRGFDLAGRSCLQTQNPIVLHLPKIFLVDSSVIMALNFNHSYPTQMYACIKLQV